jgi:hypothetical protein
MLTLAGTVPRVLRGLPRASHGSERENLRDLPPIQGRQSLAALTPHAQRTDRKSFCQATAFCMSQNSRLGAKSMVPLIQNDVLSLIFEVADPWHGKNCIQRPLGGI